MLDVKLTLTLFKARLGRSNGGQSGLPAFDLGRDIQIGLVVLGLVDTGGLLKQPSDLGFEFNLACIRPELMALWRLALALILVPSTALVFRFNKTFT